MNCCSITHLEEIDSTNAYALRNFADLKDQTLIIADRQTKGRGRRGRSWISPANENLYASFVIKDFPFPVSHASWIGSLATLECLKIFASVLKFWLKWPNDIFCDSRKIAGLLSEVKTDNHNRPLGIIIGIGVNLNMRNDLLEAIDQPATSVLAETGIPVNIGNFAEALAISLSTLYNTCSTDGTTSLWQRWKEENALLNREIEMTTEDNVTLNGTVVDFGANGELILNTGKDIITLLTGDVSIKKPPKG